MLWTSGNYPCIVVILYFPYMCDFEVVTSFKAYGDHLFVYLEHRLIFYTITSNFYRQYFTRGNGIVGFASLSLCAFYYPINI